MCVRTPPGTHPYCAPCPVFLCPRALVCSARPRAVTRGALDETTVMVTFRNVGPAETKHCATVTTIVRASSCRESRINAKQTDLCSCDF